jgi:hypothetical protein
MSAFTAAIGAVTDMCPAVRTDAKCQELPFGRGYFGGPACDNLLIVGMRRPDRTAWPSVSVSDATWRGSAINPRLFGFKDSSERAGFWRIGAFAPNKQCGDLALCPRKRVNAQTLTLWEGAQDASWQ